MADDSAFGRIARALEAIAKTADPAFVPPVSCSDEIRIFTALAAAGWKPETVYDIGASNGIWSALLRAVFPEAAYHMFEPLAKRIPEYENSLELITRYHSKFHVHAIALGATTQKITMRIDGTGVGSTSLDMGQASNFTPFTVQQRELDDYVRDAQLPLPDLIKLDTQGAELSILTRAEKCLKHASMVFTEAWFIRGYGPKTPLFGEILIRMNLFDYELAELGQRFYDGNHRLYGCDALFVKREVLAKLAPGMSCLAAW